MAIHHDELLEVAERLLVRSEGERGRLSRARVRRSISTAYYALFTSCFAKLGEALWGKKASRLNAAEFLPGRSHTRASELRSIRFEETRSTRRSQISSDRPAPQAERLLRPTLSLNSRRSSSTLRTKGTKPTTTSMNGWPKPMRSFYHIVLKPVWLPGRQQTQSMTETSSTRFRF
jgi:hypothetical protein